MLETDFIFRQQKIEFKPMSGMIRLLCNRMFCCIFGKWTPTGSGPQPEVDPQPEVGPNRKWTPTGSGSKPEVDPQPDVDPNWKDAQNISWTQTGKIIRKLFHLSALELFCCLLPLFLLSTWLFCCLPPLFCCLLDSQTVRLPQKKLQNVTNILILARINWL